MKPEPLADYVITPHAAFQIRRRGLNEETIWSGLSAPEQELEVRQGRAGFQSRRTLGAPSKTYLVRVFVDVDRRPAEVVTAYRTSKISKYWREEP